MPHETTSYEEHALRRLREAGYRITMPRVQVVRALASTDQALSAYAIHDKIISSGGKIDVVSVYRILATLTEEKVGLAKHIGIVDGYVKQTTPVGENGGIYLVDPESREVETLSISQLLPSLSQLLGASVSTDKLKNLDLNKVSVEIPYRRTAP